MSIFNKNGRVILDNSKSYLVNNITETKTATDWTFGGSVNSSGVAVLTGANPAITSKTFTVNPDDIICFEFTVSLPTPSTTTGGPGLYLGTVYGQAVYVHSFNPTTKTWTKSTSTNTNPYFLNSYNSTNSLTLKNYILGYNVDITKIPFLGETTNNSYTPKAIQLSGTNTTTNIRAGYNSNSSMVINFSNPKIYKVTQNGFCEVDKEVSVNKGWIEASSFYEI